MQQIFSLVCRSLQDPFIIIVATVIAITGILISILLKTITQEVSILAVVIDFILVEVGSMPFKEGVAPLVHLVVIVMV